jgi:hypothetical protein
MLKTIKEIPAPEIDNSKLILQRQPSTKRSWISKRRVVDIRYPRGAKAKTYPNRVSRARIKRPQRDFPVMAG